MPCQFKMQSHPRPVSLRRAAIEAQSYQDKAFSPSIESPVNAVERKTLTACCVAEQYDLKRVADILRNYHYKLDPNSTSLSPQVVHIELPTTTGSLPQMMNGQTRACIGDVFIFPSGTIVAWNVAEETLIHLATKTLLPAVVNPHLERLETEDLEYVEDLSKDSSSMKGDTIYLGCKSGNGRNQAVVTDSAEADEIQRALPENPTSDVNITLAKIAFSSGLARSTKLAVLESLLNEYFESTRSIPTMLSRGKGLPFTRSFVLQKTGQLMSIRAQLNLYSELTDSLPDLFWDSRYELGLERSYDQVGRALDVGIRIKTLNEKMDYAQEIASVLRGQLSEQHGNRLEWIIIALITIEVGFEVRRIYNEKRSSLSDVIL
ncbi:hypothetical protein MMC26_005512 [Xylographa opegraphella]|nr:hypothetical protein [Xylographa opegraphella]